MGPRSRLSTRDRPTGCEEETICAGRSAATHRRRRCSGLSELLAVSLDKARRQRAERLCAHAGHDVGGEVVELVAIWASRSAGSISKVGYCSRRVLSQRTDCSVFGSRTRSEEQTSELQSLMRNS